MKVRTNDYPLPVRAYFRFYNFYIFYKSVCC